MVDWPWGEQFTNDHQGNNKMFWKEVKQVRKDEQSRDEMVKDVNGEILRDGVEVMIRLAEYFEQVLNVADVRDKNIKVAGNWQMSVLGCWMKEQYC